MLGAVGGVDIRLPLIRVQPLLKMAVTRSAHRGAVVCSRQGHEEALEAMPTLSRHPPRFTQYAEEP
jgi:hypothetical protein